MTTNPIITNTELEAIRSVERYIATSIPRGEPFSPSQLVQEDIETVSYMLARLAPAPPVEEVASRPNSEDTGGSPIGIVRDHPSHGEGENSHRPSVVDRGSKEIEARWAKETIGLVVVELNEAYAQFEITRDNGSIPSGALYQASRRLEEAMQRLGITGDEIPF